MELIYQAIADVIRALFINPAHVALLISMAANVAMGWFILTIRKENRLDWQSQTATIKEFVGVLDKLRMLLAVELKNHDL